MPRRPQIVLPALTAVSLALAAGPAAALSCMRPDPVAAFAHANAAEEVYVAVLGKITGGPGPRAEGDGMNGERRSYLATFTGHTLNRNGPFEAIDQQITVEEGCAGPWCADVLTDKEMLTFLQVLPDGTPLLNVGPCYGNLFYDPTPEMLQTIQSCFAKGCTTM